MKPNYPTPPLRPKLTKMPFEEFDPIKPGQISITMSIGQWDELLQQAWDRGYVLIELDYHEVPVAIYRNPNPKPRPDMYLNPNPKLFKQ